MMDGPHEHEHEHTHNTPHQAAVLAALGDLTERGDLVWRVSALRELTAQLDDLVVRLDMDASRALLLTSEGEWIGALRQCRGLRDLALAQPGLSLAPGQVKAHLDRILTLAAPPTPDQAESAR